MKIAAWTLVLAQSLAINAFAASPQITNATPEFRLLQASVALGGQGLTTEQYQTSISKLVGEYHSTATADGSADRFEKAMIDLKIATPEDAATLSHELVSASYQLNSSTTTEQDAQKTANVMAQVMGHSSQGAQFSGGSCAMTLGMTAAGLAFFSWGISDNYNPNSNQGMTIICAMFDGAWAILGYQMITQNCR